ncbi:bifunctional glycosyltransferase/CDP-glycerol:glycerophosphate glycerophosphotransferase [Glutamicibacter soli]|uniref:bifunctional glycosyltransferase/CDP-glycerol:glycerophosphate glycerophosphotransferase n=1 Tax=Glutamicibacter soli TaxID=453836 RepID=UPI003C76B0FB
MIHLQLAQDPKLTLVVSMYKVEEYLGEFLSSLSVQKFNQPEVEIIFVNDGSPDNSSAIVADWLNSSHFQGRVLNKENGGLSSARNLGIDEARGEWITFPDPDDILSNNYLEVLLQRIAESDARSSLITTNIQFYDDKNNEVNDTHPLRSKFDKKFRIVNLERHPNYIHLSAATGIYRVAKIRNLKLRFEEEVKPNFEDGVFTAKYLLNFKNPTISLLGNAIYYYRRREDGSSMVQTAWSKKDKYTTLPKYGYLNLLKFAKKNKGYIPEWMQNTILYDIFWFLREDDRIHSGCSNVPAEWAREFHRLISKALNYIDASTIEDFNVTKTHWHHRQMLLFGYKKLARTHTETSVNSLETETGLVRLRYCYGSTQPSEEFRARGRKIMPTHATRRAYTLLGKTLLTERIVWLPAAGTLSLRLDEEKVPLRLGGYEDKPYDATPARMWKELARQELPEIYGKGINHAQALVDSRTKTSPDSVRYQRPKKSIRPHELLLTLQKEFAQSMLHRLNDLFNFPERINDYSAEEVALATGLARKKETKFMLRNAWILVDRDIQANDNAEHLYRYIYNNRPDINAWFAIRKDSKDWERLAKEGFKLVDFGSLEYFLLLRNSINLISSQVDHYIVNPFERGARGGYPWKFTFLQHGITQNNVSRWLNGKPIELFVTASKHEFTDLTMENSEYRFTSKEVQLTGFPRFDRLYNLSSQRPKQDLLLLMPTWRRSLLGDQINDGNLRSKIDAFSNSKYAKAYEQLLGSSELRDYAQKNGLKIGFMPHPNMSPYLKDFTVPNYVEIYSYETSNVQDLILRSKVCITDYSSVAFDAAYAGTPVVYYQFDQQEFYDGTHVFRKGNWDYSKNGLGPVCLSLQEIMQSLNQISNNGFNFSSLYSERLQYTFGTRHGESCRNVVQAVEDLRSPVKYKNSYKLIQ